MFSKRTTSTRQGNGTSSTDVCRTCGKPAVMIVAGGGGLFRAGFAPVGYCRKHGPDDLRGNGLGSERARMAQMDADLEADFDARADARLDGARGPGKRGRTR